jgi:predicted HicB family RNase H-like nuclease
VHAKTGRGRPSLTGQASRSPQVTFRLPPELRAAAESQAAREGRRVSDLAREALAEYLQRHTAS